MDDAENPIHQATDIDERREMPRCSVDVPVTLVVLTQGTMLVGRIAELSLSGCRVLLPKTLSHAVRASVECTFKIRSVGFRLVGVVEWAENNLAGLQFKTMTAHCRDDLMEVLCEIESENDSMRLVGVNSAAPLPAPETAPDSPAIEAILAEAAARNPAHARAKKGGWNPFAGMANGIAEPGARDLTADAPRAQIWPGAPASQPASETVPGRIFNPVLAMAPTPAGEPAKETETGMVSYPEAEAAPVPAPVTHTSSYGSRPAAHPNRGSDRRAAHRCGVDTSAIIDLVKVRSKLKGHIVDLSVGGCRIKTLERFPVGIYTRIETEFQLHGLPFRLGGVIQAIHDRNTVGIRFLDMSQRKKDQVAELVGELEESGGEQVQIKGNSQ
jgi:c-di-GMP-binding flagellar brake protein YcgR